MLALLHTLFDVLVILAGLTFGVWVIGSAVSAWVRTGNPFE